MKLTHCVISAEGQAEREDYYITIQKHRFSPAFPSISACLAWLECWLESRTISSLRVSNYAEVNLPGMGNALAAMEDCPQGVIFTPVDQTESRKVPIGQIRQWRNIEGNRILGLSGSNLRRRLTEILSQSVYTYHAVRHHKPELDGGDLLDHLEQELEAAYMASVITNQWQVVQPVQVYSPSPINASSIFDPTPF